MSEAGRKGGARRWSNGSEEKRREEKRREDKKREEKRREERIREEDLGVHAREVVWALR